MSEAPDNPADDPGNEAEPRQRWLSAVQADARTDARHHAAAEVIAHEPEVPAEHTEAAEELVRMGLAWRNELDGVLSYTPIDPAGKPG
ncbi:hypothetical protein ACAG25_09020 [Mycobacterium sp. pV006]|uniref:hypothetical protein n=1 Tax=Mycobacterium sp. pV006 TaxID=3238983 RepID=UPI00351BA0C4